MDKDRSNRESNKVRNIAQEYEERGFLVLREPSPESLPLFLRGLDYHPDLIAKSESKNFIIEVKSTGAIKDSTSLIKAAELINEQPDWELDLVLTNPRIKDKPIIEEQIDFDELQADFNRAISLSNMQSQQYQENYSDAALLLLWAYLESLMRLILKLEDTSYKSRSAGALVRDLTIQGIISRRQNQFLERMLKIRNEIAHGRYGGIISYDDLGKISSIGISMIEEISKQLDSRITDLENE